MSDESFRAAERALGQALWDRAHGKPDAPTVTDMTRIVLDAASGRYTHLGALVAIHEQVRAIEALPWWRRGKRRLHWLAIRDTLTVVLDEGMVTRGSRAG